MVELSPSPVPGPGPGCGQGVARVGAEQRAGQARLADQQQRLVGNLHNIVNIVNIVNIGVH